MLQKPKKLTTPTFLGHTRPNILIFELNMAMQGIKLEVFEVTKNAAISFHQNAPETINKFDFFMFFLNMVIQGIKIVVIQATQ